MELKQFDGQIRSELSMIEVAHAVLTQKGEVMDFTDLLKEVIDFLDMNEQSIEEKMPQFYADLNVDGSFISLGENLWGLREWYPVDSIDEELTHDNDEDEIKPRRRKKGKKSAFATSEDEIDYNDDDPEDRDVYEGDEAEEEEEEEVEYGERVDVSDHGVMVDEEDEEDLGEYKADLSALGADEEEEDDLPDGVEGDLSLIEDEDLDEEEEEY
ncbi:DNA-directed RNA polymerase subunit delta [Pisciglobus halotolerans]|uniref:Probable DNA-directed RNA polymerase subunit delta n=1 Tax=Pisciglobus halotolerans TaxID=745365 RepID=A0A1I3D6P0_9LACT|nr:DNA-directed RNA polymerase subunit delta [Pisciglobus halotolerans]SFH82404.1 DNA-directed RNA polymerase subunit delta [Pisciglobus halotolerans]